MPTNTFQIGLQSGYVLIYDWPDANIWDIRVPKSFTYAIVDQVYNGCLTTVEGNTIMYRKDDRIALVHSSGEFFIIKESDIISYQQNYSLSL